MILIHMVYYLQCWIQPSTTYEHIHSFCTLVNSLVIHLIHHLLGKVMVEAIHEGD